MLPECANLIPNAYASMESVSEGESWRRFFLMNFLRFWPKGETAKNAAKVERGALGRINSDGG